MGEGEFHDRDSIKRDATSSTTTSTITTPVRIENLHSDNKGKFSRSY